MGLRKVAAASVHASRAHGSRQSDQGAVWSAVAGHEGSFDSSSPTGSYLDAVESARERLDELVSGFAEPRAGQSGVVVGIGGHIQGLEFFGSERLLRAHWEDLVRGAAADSVGAAEIETPSRRARRFVRAVEGADIAAVPGVGGGEELTASIGSLVVNGSRLDQRVLHLTAFELVEAA